MATRKTTSAAGATIFRIPDAASANNISPTAAGLALRRVRQAHGALNVWRGAATSGELIDHDAASPLQVSAAAICGAIYEAERATEDSLKAGAMMLMYARNLVGTIDTALWNFVGRETESAPSAKALSDMAELAGESLSEFLKEHGPALEGIAGEVLPAERAADPSSALPHREQRLRDVAHGECDALWDVIAVLEAAHDMTEAGEAADEDKTMRVRRLTWVAQTQVRAVIDAFSAYI